MVKTGTLPRGDPPDVDAAATEGRDEVRGRLGRVDEDANREPVARARRQRRDEPPGGEVEHRHADAFPDPVQLAADPLLQAARFAGGREVDLDLRDGAGQGEDEQDA